MQNKQKRRGYILDYFICILLVTILVLITFLLPELYNSYIDTQELNRIQVMEREDFSFKELVDMTIQEKVQQMMAALDAKNELRRTLYLEGKDAADAELMERLREALDITIQYQMLPDISAYDLENHIVYAEYYNLSDGVQDSEEIAFWNIRFSDYETFDFSFRIDATETVIYQAELYCIEVSEYLKQLTDGDITETETLNMQFVDGCEKYYEVDGYDILTGKWSEEIAIMLGYERGEYAVYRDPCLNGYLNWEGIRWGFVPMTVALEKGNTVNEWGYRGIVGYYADVYGVDIYEEPISNDK